MKDFAPKRPSSRQSRPPVTWGIALLLALAAALAVLALAGLGVLGPTGDLLSNYVESVFGLGHFTYIGISVLSAVPERIAFFAGVLLVLLVITVLPPRILGYLSPRSRILARLSGPGFVNLARIAAVWLFLCALFLVFRPVDPRYAAIVWTNSLALVPAHLIAAGYALLLFAVPKAFSVVLRRQGARRDGALMVVAVLTAAVVSVVPHGERLLRASHLIFPEPAVRKLDTGGIENLGGVHVDPVHDSVIVLGHGTDRLMVYDLGDVAAGPRQSAAKTSGAQNFALNPERREAYLYHHGSKELLVIDTDKLSVKQRIGGIDLASGDPVLAWDDAGRVVIASEGPMRLPKRVENAFVVVDLDAGRVVARHAEYLGEGLYFDPRRRRFYGTYFRGRHDILVYDPDRDLFPQRVPMPTNRMTMIGADPVSGEIIVAFPLASKLVRLDPDTLAVKGEIPAMLGARRFAFDLKRGVVVCLSLLSSLSVIDMKSGETLASYRLPQPWLRNVAIDSKRGKAYVTGRHGFYEVDYAARLPE